MSKYFVRVTDVEKPRAEQDVDDPAFKEHRKFDERTQTDWSKTQLGPMEDWSETLMLHVSLSLGCPHPAIMGWGSDLTREQHP